MKTSPYTKLCAVALFGVLASCSAPPTAVSRMAVSSSFGKEVSLPDRLFTEVNSYRASKGKSALQRHPGLDRLAQQHCDYLVKNGGSYGMYGKSISHIGFEGRALSARQAYKISSLGENVVSSANSSAQHLVGLWAGSRNHDYNMRNDWACTGIATAVNADGEVISTQLFGNAPSGSHRQMAGRFSNQW
jgi:uncharacterized protein YkwD